MIKNVLPPRLQWGTLYLRVKGGVATPLPRAGFNAPPAEASTPRKRSDVGVRVYYIMNTLQNFIIQSAEIGRDIPAEEGSMPVGYNGPHNEHETHVRNTAHRLITSLKAYEYKGKIAFKKVAKSDANYLASKKSTDECYFLVSEESGKRFF